MLYDFYFFSNIERSYFQNHLGPISAKMSEGRPRLFSMDGHASHVTLEVVDYCVNNGIHLMCFPAHLTHMIQPLDVAVFGPLQRAYSKKAKAWIRDSSNKRMSLASFFLLYHQARSETITNKMIARAFSGTGLYPINEARVLDKLPSQSSESSSSNINDTRSTSGSTSFSDTSIPIDPFAYTKTPRCDKVMQDLYLASRNPINTAPLQLQSLLKTSVKAAQAAMADRDMYKSELQKLRLANANRPEEAEDSRARKYGEEVTAEEVVSMRRLAVEKKKQADLEKEERKRERELRAEERRVEEIERKERVKERQLRAEKNKQEEAERKLQREVDMLEREHQKEMEEAQRQINRQLREDTRKAKEVTRIAGQLPKTTQTRCSKGGTATKQAKTNSTGKSKVSRLHIPVESVPVPSNPTEPIRTPSPKRQIQHPAQVDANSSILPDFILHAQARGRALSSFDISPSPSPLVPEVREVDRPMGRYLSRTLVVGRNEERVLKHGGKGKQVQESVEAEASKQEPMPRRTRLGRVVRPRERWEPS